MEGYKMPNILNNNVVYDDNTKQLLYQSEDENGNTRVSTEMQPQSALDSQEAVACEFAKCNNIDIIKVFSDKGISGTTDNRPNFQEMIKYVENQNNDIQLIIVYKLDRLFRHEQLFDVYEYRLNKCGVFVLSATE